MKFLLAILFTFASIVTPQNITNIDTLFHNGEIKLGGTLTIPNNIKNPPCIILLTGSGNQTRDEDIFGFKIFKQIADSLSAKGIAVFRFDDRGMGESSIGSGTTTTADYAEDALSAIDFMKSFKKFGKIGLLGHSEGGVASIIAASSSDEVDFIILMAGPTIGGGKVSLYQIELLLKKNNLPDSVINRKLELEREIIRNVKNGENPEKMFRPIFDEALKGYSRLPESVRKRFSNDTTYAKLYANQTVGSLKNPWVKFWFSYSPKDDLGQIECPILALYGGLDTQVPAKEDSVALRQATDFSGNKNIEVIIFPMANHLFQKATTGMPNEYSSLEKSFVPGFLDSIATWINRLK